MAYSYVNLIADFVVDLVRYGAWPVLFAFLALRFGKQFIEMIKYIAENFRSGKFGPFEIIMTEKMAEATEAAEEAGITEADDEAETNEDLPSFSRTRTRTRRRKLEEMTEHPVGTIMIKYSEVEEALREAVLAHNLEEAAGTPSGRILAGKAIHVLREHDRITGAEWETLRSLNSIRNELAHAPPKELRSVNIAFAATFVRLADGMIKRLRLVVAQPSRETSTDETP